MKTITHTDGQEYILKSEVDTLVSQRLSKTAERARTSDARILELEAQIDHQKTEVAKVDALNSQLAMLQGDLSAERAKYQQHSTISTHGIHDADIRDHVVLAYDRSQRNIAKKDRQDLGSWLESMKGDPSAAPAILRPHLQSLGDQPAAAAAPPVSATPTAPTGGGVAVASSAPQGQGTIPAPSTASTQDLLSRAGDPNFYSQNRAAIREAWYRNRGRSGPFKY